MIKNPYQNFATRKLQLVTGERTKVLDFDLDTGETWQAWIFSNEETNKSTFVQFDLRGSFGTIGSIETTIPGGVNNGDIITGSGACIVFATGQSNNDISIWFTPEQKYLELPPSSQQFTIAGAGATQIIGYPPFGRYKFAIRSTNSFNVVFKNDSGTTVYNQTVDPVFNSSLMNLIYHAPNTTLEIVSSVINQNFSITHYRS